MQSEWQTIEYEAKPYKESGTFIIGGIDEIVALLDEHIVKTQTMRGSPYIKVLYHMLLSYYCHMLLTYYCHILLTCECRTNDSLLPNKYTNVKPKP